VKLPLGAMPAIRKAGRGLRVRPEHFTIADDGAEAEIVVVEPTGWRRRSSPSLGRGGRRGVRERHKFEPGDKIRLKQIRHWCICSTRRRGKRLNA